MAVLFGRIETRQMPDTTTTPAQRLRTTMAACRVRFTWFGVQKSLTPQQKAQAAEAFDAEGPFLSAGKKLVDTKEHSFRAVTAMRGKIAQYWRGLTLPFPEPGIRLIRQDQVGVFSAAMADHRAELNDAVANLDRHYAALKRTAAEQLGTLYNDADYPETLRGLFDVAYDFPNVEPPDYLVAMNPHVYEEERARVAGRFEEAVRLAEQAFLEEFTRLVEHLSERITGSSDEGTAKVFRDSAVRNLVDFFARFRDLNVSSNLELDALVEQAQRAVRGVAAQDLRNSTALRERVSSQLGRVRETLDALLINRPRRRILRQTSSSGEA
jgi:hypothetical protein